MPSIGTWDKVYIRWHMSIFTKRHDRNIVSYCSPQVYNILKDNINSPFLEFYKNSGQVAYDKNKQYTSILRSCDNFGWSLFNPTDEVKRYPGENIETGLYFVEISNSFQLKRQWLVF